MLMCRGVRVCLTDSREAPFGWQLSYAEASLILVAFQLLVLRQQAAQGSNSHARETRRVRYTTVEKGKGAAPSVNRVPPAIH